MAISNGSDDRDVATQEGAFEQRFVDYLKRSDRRSPLPSHLMEALQRDTPINKHTSADSPESGPSSPSPIQPFQDHQESARRLPGPWHAKVFEGHILQGRYRIDKRVAKGGMSWIYKGWHLAFDRPLAIKILFPELVEEPTFLRRFFDEARALSRLEHSHIVRVFDVFEENGVVGMVLEWVEGCNLYEWMQRQEEPLSLGQIGALFLPMLDALACVHGNGMIHRDLKPDNVLLDLTNPGSPIPKLADFGLVRAEGLRSRARTQTGHRLGTPLYMSPEQIRDSKHATKQADLYSMGAILYEFVLGSTPFVGEEQWLLYQHINCAPPHPARVWSGVPSALASVLCRALEKDPGRRWQSSHEMQVALEPVLQKHSTLQPIIEVPVASLPASPPLEPSLSEPPVDQRSRGLRWVWAVVLLLLVVLATWKAGALLGGWEHATRHHPKQTRTAPPTAQPDRGALAPVRMRQSPQVERPKVRPPQRRTLPRERRYTRTRRLPVMRRRRLPRRVRPRRRVRHHRVRRQRVVVPRPVVRGGPVRVVPRRVAPNKRADRCVTGLSKRPSHCPPDPTVGDWK
jgi:serine/threonine protein kinase